MSRLKGTPKTGGRDFPKGVSGNPGGMPKIKPFRDAYQKLAAMTGQQIQALDIKSLSGAELVALGILREAIKGKPPAAQEAADRTEGKVKQEVELGGAGSFDEETLDKKIRDLLGIAGIGL